MPAVFSLTLAAGAPEQTGGAPPDQKARTEAVELAKTTLSREKSIATASMEIESVSAVRWSDTSLGCPAAGMMYAQRLVSGYQVVLRAAGTSYSVHVGDGHAVVCDKGGAGEAASAAKVPPLPQGEPDAKAARLAREALASARGVPPEKVLVKRVRPFNRSETRCRVPEARKADAGPAYLVELSLGDATFEYYADQKTAYSCDAK
ncbi:MAG: hypothetical protein ACRD1S_17535 [Vicinamibacterales bacterium]